MKVHALKTSKTNERLTARYFLESSCHIRSYSGKQAQWNKWYSPHNSWNLQVCERSKMPTEEASESDLVLPLTINCQRDTRPITLILEMLRYRSNWPGLSGFIFAFCSGKSSKQVTGAQSTDASHVPNLTTVSVNLLHCMLTWEGIRNIWTILTIKKWRLIWKIGGILYHVQDYAFLCFLKFPTWCVNVNVITLFIFELSYIYKLMIYTLHHYVKQL